MNKKEKFLNDLNCFEPILFRVLAVDAGDKTSVSNVAVYAPNPQGALEDLGLTAGIVAAIAIGAFAGTFLIAGAVFWHKKNYGW